MEARKEWLTCREAAKMAVTLGQYCRTQGVTDCRQTWCKQEPRTGGAQSAGWRGNRWTAMGAGNGAALE